MGSQTVLLVVNVVLFQFDICTFHYKNYTKASSFETFAWFCVSQAKITINVPAIMFHIDKSSSWERQTNIYGLLLEVFAMMLLIAIVFKKSDQVIKTVPDPDAAYAKFSKHGLSKAFIHQLCQELGTLKKLLQLRFVNTCRRTNTSFQFECSGEHFPERERQREG